MDSEKAQASRAIFFALSNQPIDELYKELSNNKKLKDLIDQSSIKYRVLTQEESASGNDPCVGSDSCRVLFSEENVDRIVGGKPTSFKVGRKDWTIRQVLNTFDENFHPVDQYQVMVQLITKEQAQQAQQAQEEAEAAAAAAVTENASSDT
jgi:hypothetical protein